jgi:prepilin-type N-terminal cleavage/methylation domain-containing protein
VTGQSDKRNGFTLIELLLAMAVFLLICAAMFGLLQLSQQRYSSETQLSGAFQEARLAVDQISRDVNDAGFPSAGMFSKLPDPTLYAVSPVAWVPGYPSIPTCLIGTGGGGTCTTPGDFDLILETTLQTPTGPVVSWIRYQLPPGSTTLYRAVVAKTDGDPAGAFTTPGVMVPFLNNVMNNATGQFSQITASYPAMFPTGPVPLFQYMCDTPTGTIACPNAATTYNSPQNIRDVDITLIVQTQQPDAQTGQLELIELNGRGRRLNPSN